MRFFDFVNTFVKVVVEIIVCVVVCGIIMIDAAREGIFFCAALNENDGKG